MGRRFITFGAITLTLALINPIKAEQQLENGANTSLGGLLACRKLPQAEQRLACFDAESAKLDSALSRKDVVVVSSREVKAAQKSIFGLSLPKLTLFGGSPAVTDAQAADEEGVGYIESKLADARQNSEGKWVLVLEDGARWAQTDTSNIRTPKTGDVVRIRKAALGSFMANISGRPAIRVRRLS